MYHGMYTLYGEIFTSVLNKCFESFHAIVDTGGNNAKTSVGLIPAAKNASFV